MKNILFIFLILSPILIGFNYDNYQTQKVWGTYLYAGIVNKFDDKTMTATIEAKEPLEIGDIIEFLLPNKIVKFKIIEMLENNRPTNRVTPTKIFQIKTNQSIPSNCLVRIKRKIWSSNYFLI